MCRWIDTFLYTKRGSKELGVLTKDKSRWEENIPYVSSLLAHKSEKNKAKALWLLGEMGLEHPKEVKESVKEIVSFCDSQVPLLRERAVNALGRIREQSSSCLIFTGKH